MSASGGPDLASVFRWRAGSLERFDDGDQDDAGIRVADSWLVDEGRVLALDLHRRRFLHALTESGSESDDGGVDVGGIEVGGIEVGGIEVGGIDVGGIGAGGIDADGIDAEGIDAAGIDAAEFWAAVVSATPTAGTWFPRVELRDGSVAPSLVYRLRAAPTRRRSAVLATAPGPDPRSRPGIKGPDFAAMSRLRTEVGARGADEAVICSPEGYVIEGAYSALLWWRGETLCAPSPELERVDSVTARSVIALATALGVDVLYESVRPDDLDGLEIWVCSALHGIRIATAWIEGPQPAESPGRLSLWRERLGRLSRRVDNLDR